MSAIAPAPSYQVPWWIRLFRQILRLGFRLLFILLSRVKVTGRENVPARGAYIVAINHVSLYEAPFILAYWPTLLEVVGAVEIWSKPGQSALARLYGGIPLHREQYDRRVLNILFNVLDSGRPLLIAPEGGRSHTPGMRRGYPGVAFLMEVTHAPVLPVGIVGTTEDLAANMFSFKRPALELHIGAPIHLSPIDVTGSERRAARQAAADRVMLKIAALLPQEYRGVYDGRQIGDSKAAGE